MAKMTPAQEAAYAIDWNLSRDGLKPEVQVEYDRQVAERRSRPRPRRSDPDAVFPALCVQVRGDAVESYATDAVLGPLAGAEARLTDGSQAWSPGRAAFMPLALAGLATKTKATAFVIFADGTYAESALDGNAAVRAAQAEAVRFNLMAGRREATADPEPQEDTAATLRKLAALRDEGLLTDEEYAAKRAEVIARI
jgi:Short C-terminal domain